MLCEGAILMKRLLKIMLRTGVFCLVITAGLLVWVILVGIPAPLVESLVNRKTGDPLHFTCTSARVSPLRGLIVKDVRLELKRDGTDASLEAEDMTLSPRLERSEQESTWTFGVVLENGTFRQGPSAPLTLQQVDAMIAWSEDTLDIRQFEAYVGKDQQAGPVRGNLQYHLAGKTYEGRIESACMFTPFADLLPPNLTGVVSSLTFRAPPLISATLSGNAEHPASGEVEGRWFAGHVTRHEASMDLLSGSFAYRDHAVHLDDLYAMGSNGVLRADLRVDLRAQEVHLNIEDTADPHTVARFIHPFLERLLQPYHFEGPTHLKGEVVLGYGTNSLREIHATISERRLGIGRYIAEDAHGQLDLLDDRLQVDGIMATWCGGELTGSVDVFKSAASSNRMAKLDMNLASADLHQVVRTFSTSPKATNYVGKVEAALKVSGPTAGFENNMQGEGTLRIHACDLLSTGLWRDLHRYLSTIHLGWKEVPNQEFNADFALSGKTLDIENFTLQGGLSTISGKGTYAFDGTVHIQVELELLGKGFFAEITHILTKPVSKLLEFECTGTVSDPKWNMVRGPPAMLRHFRERSDKSD
jgi:hypothetical protein